jgi:hypothetical protein
MLILCMRTWRRILVNTLTVLSLPSHSFQSLVAAQKSWRSPIYSFFNPVVTVKMYKGHVAHFFKCSAQKCKTQAKGVRHYQDKADKTSSANLQHHAIRCFGEDTVNAAIAGEAHTNRSGNIFQSFACQGQWQVTYSNCLHTNPEFW